MHDAIAGRMPLWQRVVQFPLVRLVLLGGIVAFLMAWTEGRLLAFDGSPAIGIAIALGMGLVAIAIYAAYAKVVERRDVTELSGPGIGREWAVGAAIGAGFYVLCVLVLMWLGIYRIEGLNPVAFLVPAVAMAVKSGIFEELLFRGVIFRSVEDMAGSWVAIFISSAVFGLLHLLNPDASMAGAIYISIEAGLLLAGAYLVTRRLWLCIGFHMAWNYVQSAVFSGIVSGGFVEPGLIRPSLEGPDILTGGSFGMERSVVALVVCTTAGLVLILIAARRGHIRPARWSR